MHSSRCVRLGSDLTDSAKTVITHRARLGSRGPVAENTNKHGAPQDGKKSVEKIRVRERETRKVGAPLGRWAGKDAKTHWPDGHPPATGIHTISHSPSQRVCLVAPRRRSAKKYEQKEQRQDWPCFCEHCWTLRRGFFPLGPSRTLAFSASLKSRHLSIFFYFSNSFAISHHAKFHGVSHVLACVFTTTSIPNVSLSLINLIPFLCTDSSFSSLNFI